MFMSTLKSSLILLLLLLPLLASTASSSAPKNGTHQAVQLVLEALALAQSQVGPGLNKEGPSEEGPWADCLQMYGNSEDRILRLANGGDKNYDYATMRTWLDGALTGHVSCTDGLRERNGSSILEYGKHKEVEARMREALATLAESRRRQETYERPWNSTAAHSELLTLWDASSQSADIVVDQDGFGHYRTINEAVAALHRQHTGGRRVIVYVKAGVYAENVEISRVLRNVMFVGDGIDRTVVTGKRSVPGGYTTYRSATFGVSGDGFWARDMTFVNTAGPEKNQAVALRVEADHSIFYRCSFKAYQDTLYVHSLRQFYRDCHIYGTIDFIFGNGAAVIQNCEIFIRKPMDHQSNMITAQGRDNPFQTTGISVHSSRIRPTQDLEPVKESFKSYLGRPWRKYSRTVFLKSDLDGLIHPAGWAEWSGGFGLDTLYYGEYMNTGEGAATGRRVKWPGFHVLRDSSEANAFGVERFIQGGSWIPESGVPFWPGI